MPLTSAFYTPAQPPAMFRQLEQEAAAFQPPPVPDLFARPITPAVAQGGFNTAPPPPAPGVTNQGGQTPPPGGAGGGQGGGASQMAQALLLYQMLLGGGPMGFLNQLMPGQGQTQQYRGVGGAGGAFGGLTDPAVAALFNQGSYGKMGGMGGPLQARMDPAQRGLYAGQAPGVGLQPDAYQNAITFLAQLLGLG